MFALGFVSVYDQIMEGMPSEERAKIFAAYLSSLGEDAAKYRADAERMEQQAAASGDSLTPSDSGNDVQKCLARVAGLAAEGKFGYNRFFAIGLFRLLELTGAKEPAALERLVKAVGVRAESVNKARARAGLALAPLLPPPPRSPCAKGPPPRRCPL